MKTKFKDGDPIRVRLKFNNRVEFGRVVGNFLDCEGEFLYEVKVTNWMGGYWSYACGEDDLELVTEADLAPYWWEMVRAKAFFSEEE